MTQQTELKIAFFGESGSGKTTLLASYFGNLQNYSFEMDNHYRLEADDTSQGNELLSRFHQLENGKFPLGTDDFSEYVFNFKVDGIAQSPLKVVWYDYPGGWWTTTPSTQTAKKERFLAFDKLVQSNVGLILVDGMKYDKDGTKYLKRLFDQLKNEIGKINASIQPKEPQIPEDQTFLDKVKEFFTSDSEDVLPTQWIVALSKFDAAEKIKDADTFSRILVDNVQQEMAGLAKTLGTKRFGHRVLLLSSVKGKGAKVVDAGETVGLSLIAPLSFQSILDTAKDRMSSDVLQGWMAKFMSGTKELVKFIDKLDDFLPDKYQYITKLLQLMQLEHLLNNGEEYFRLAADKARGEKKALEALALTFSAELAHKKSKKYYHNNQSNL